MIGATVNTCINSNYTNTNVDIAKSFGTVSIHTCNQQMEADTVDMCEAAKQQWDILTGGNK